LHVSEREHYVSQWWAVDSVEYNQAKQELSTKKNSLLSTKLSSCVHDRWFLLTVKRKFSGQKVSQVHKHYFSDQIDGQYMASRISKQIAKQTGQLKSLWLHIMSLLLHVIVMLFLGMKSLTWSLHFG